MDAFNPQLETSRPPWKIVAIISGAVVLAVALIVGAVLFARSRQGVNVDAQNLARIESRLDQELKGCAQETDPEACRQRKVLLAAKSTGAEAVCANLSDENRDDCVWIVARDRQDPTACAAMADPVAAKSCADLMYAQIALATNDDAICAKIEDETRRTGCETTLAGPVTVSTCAARGKDATYCAELAVVDAAIAKSDLAACDAISTDQLKALCVDAIGIPDADGDGLDAEQEASLGTSDLSQDSDGDGLSDGQEVSTYRSDPAKADTDGDGFSDGDEVKNGYNPSGAGRLTE